MVGLLLGARVAVTRHEARAAVIRQPAAVARAGKTEFRKCLPAIDGVIMEPIQAAGELEPLRR